MRAVILGEVWETADAGACGMGPDGATPAVYTAGSDVGEEVGVLGAATKVAGMKRNRPSRYTPISTILSLMRSGMPANHVEDKDTGDECEAKGCVGEE